MSLGADGKIEQATLVSGMGNALDQLVLDTRAQLAVSRRHAQWPAGPIDDGIGFFPSTEIILKPTRAISW